MTTKLSSLSTSPRITIRLLFSEILRHLDSTPHEAKYLFDLCLSISKSLRISAKELRYYKLQSFNVDKNSLTKRACGMPPAADC